MLFAADGGVVTPAARAAEQTEIVITGSRVATDPAAAGANVSVLARADFDVEKPAQLADLLERVAGVHVDQVGGRGGTGSLYLRGADPNYTLVLVDGVRVNDPTNARGGSFDFSAFDVADVERIEVARGPYSAVYGGDALAGVVNIVTRRAPREHTAASLSADAGAYGVREIAVSAAGPAGTGNWSLGAGDSREGEVVRGNHFEARRVSGGFDTQLSANTALVLSARWAESERAAFPDDSGGFGFAALRDTERRDADEVVTGLGLTHRAGEATFSLALGLFDRNDHIDSPGIAPGVRDPFGVPPSIVDSSLTRVTGTLTGTQELSDMLSLAYGVDWQREEGDSEGTLDFGGGFVLPTSFARTRSSWAPFVEARLESRTGLAVHAGVRVDDPNDRGSVTSPRLRVAYELADSGFTLAGAWGKAFKLPSLYALGHPLVGNPQLAAERGESHEIELSQRLAGGDARWSVTWFDGEFRNAIDFDAGPPPMLVNRDRVDTRGFELAGRVALGERWSLDGHVTQARSRIASSGTQLRNRPEWRGGAMLHWHPHATLAFSAGATHVGTAFDSSIATGDVRLSAYTRVDLTAVWQVTPKLETYVAVDNVGDERYEQFIGNEARGILPRAGVRLSF